VALLTHATTNITLSLVANANLLRHHGDMNKQNDIELGTKILPGVDLALWLRLVVLVVFAAVAAGIALAAS
jgi:hypothetical protein